MMATYDGSDDLDSEQMPTYDRMAKEYKIYVNNLPQELNEDAIREVFNKYGKITGMFYRSNATWAFITYGSYREAEFAIRELNDKKPLYLQVALAKDRTAREEIQRLGTLPIEEKSDVVEPVIIHSVKSVPQSIGRGHGIRKCFAVPDVTVPSKFAQDYEEVQSSPFSTVSNAYENYDPYAHTNRLWTRGMMTITADGSRHVSLGRGFTMYEIPEPHPRIERNITKVYESRKNGLYIYADDKLKNELKKCVVCSAKTTKHCEKCLTYYCSKACQITHWPRHQTECERIPDLVEETSPVQDVRSENSKPNPVNTRINSDEVKLRRPNTPVGLSTNIQQTGGKYKTSQDTATIDKRPSSQFNNDAPKEQNSDVPKEQKVDQPVHTSNAAYNRTPQNRLNRYNAGENEDQSKKNDQSPTTLNHTRQNHFNRGYKNDVISKTSSDKETDKSDYARGTFNNNNNGDRSNPRQRNGFQNDRKSPYNQRDNNKQGRRASVSMTVSDEDLDFRKDTYLSKASFKDVEIIVPLDNNEYWVCKVEDTNTRNDLMTKLQEVAKNSPNVQPMIGDVYGVLHETIWHRAMVVSLNPVKVHFIDTGKDKTLEKDSETRDIQDLAKVARFARKIRLRTANANGKSRLLHGDKISVKMLSMDAEKTMAVEVEERSKNLVAYKTNDFSPSSSRMSNAAVKLPQSEASRSSSSNTDNATGAYLLNIIDVFFKSMTQNAVAELTVSGDIQIIEHAQDNVYTGCLVPDGFTENMERIITDMRLRCNELRVSAANYKPQLGELVCIEMNDEWCRGYVTSLSPQLHLAMVDEARIVPVTKPEAIIAYPKELLDISYYGVTCEVTNGKLQVDNVYAFRGVIKEHNKRQGNFKVEIKDAGKVIEAVIKPWQPKSPAPGFVEIKNGSKISLVSYRSHHTMYAHSLVEAETEYRNSILQRVAHYGQKAPRLSKPPSIRQLVIAPFQNDGNHYRAMVTGLQGDTATIVYIDYGNYEKINVNELLEISNDLATAQSCSSRLTLKDVPRDVPNTTEADAYLRDLVGREEPLVCTYEDGSFQNGVYLTTSAGENVNNKMKQLLKPCWKQENYDDKTCYMIRDITVAILGKVGDTVDALVLYQDGDDYMMGPSDQELVQHITDVMPDMLKEYCESKEYYIPRADELCLALYQGGWYRGVCLDPKLSQNTCQIFFIDYGNVESVDHKDVRLMPETFIRPEAMASMCKVVNLAPLDNNGKYSAAVQQKLSELIPMDSIAKIKIVENSGNGDYKIELPAVRAELVKQGLVPPEF